MQDSEGYCVVFLGPIGSPVTARRRELMSDEPKGSNTWPIFKGQPSMTDGPFPFGEKKVGTRYLHYCTFEEIIIYYFGIPYFYNNLVKNRPFPIFPFNKLHISQVFKFLT